MQSQDKEFQIVLPLEDSVMNSFNEAMKQAMNPKIEEIRKVTGMVVRVNFTINYDPSQLNAYTHYLQNNPEYIIDPDDRINPDKFHASQTYLQ